ncbi:hypothetical protein FB107DRAFT_275082 [Schizophyllum commune]
MLATIRAVSIWIETLLYGVHACLFFECMYLLKKRGTLKTMAATVFTYASIALFIVSTIHTGLNLARFIKTFVLLQGTQEQTTYWTNFASGEVLAYYVLTAIQTWIGDLLIIYRCWFVYNKNYMIIILPFVLVLSSFIISILLWTNSVTNMSALTALSNAIFPLSLSQNVLTTGAILYKILRQHRRMNSLSVDSAHSFSSMLTVARLIIESAALYLVAMLLLVIFYFAGNDAAEVFQACITPTIGINFTLLSLRLATITDSDAWGSRTTPHGAHSRSTVANVRFRTSDWRTHESGDWQSPDGVWQSPEGVWQTPDSWDTDRTRGAETELQVKTSGRELAGGLEFAPAPSTVKGSMLDDPALRID